MNSFPGALIRVTLKFKIVGETSAGLLLQMGPYKKKHFYSELCVQKLVSKGSPRVKGEIKRKLTLLSSIIAVNTAGLFFHLEVCRIKTEWGAHNWGVYILSDNRNCAIGQ